MQFSTSLKRNYEFRRAYQSGKSAASPRLAVYCRKMRGQQGNRVGFTVGTKVGKAVVRNRVRRKLREIYRLHEKELRTGFDIVIVARVRSQNADYHVLERELMGLFEKLGLTQ